MSNMCPGVGGIFVKICILLFFCVSACYGCLDFCQRCSDGIIQCRNIGLTSIPQNFPVDSLTVDLTMNQITSVRRQSFQSLPSVLSLKLNNNKINRFHSHAFSNLPNLMTLDLTNNELTTINNRAFQGLTHLSTLSLSANNIQSLNRALAKTPEITSLNMRSNQMASIHEFTFQRNTRLRQLDLSNNRISSIHGRAFQNLRMLRYLILNNNPLIQLPQLIFSGAMLQLVDFSNCQLTRVPRIMPPSLLDFRLGHNNIEQVQNTDLQNITHLKLLTLNDNRISNFAYRALRGLDNLEELWLSRNELVYIPRGLPNNLKKLYQEFNRVVELESRLFLPESKLESLTLENNQIETVNEDALHGLQWLNFLNLQGNVITELKTNTFKDLPNLQVIHLSNNPISVIQPGSFQTLENLTTLSMSYIDGETANIERNFLNGIQHVKRLELLNSPTFVQNLMRMISQRNQPIMSSLEHINLQYNNLETLPQSLQHIAGSAGEILLDGNPWHCDRQLIWLKQWLITTDKTFFSYEAPVCESPQQLNGRSVTSLSNSEFVRVNSSRNPQLHNRLSGAMIPSVAADDVSAGRSKDMNSISKSKVSATDVESSAESESKLRKKPKDTSQTKNIKTAYKTDPPLLDHSSKDITASHKQIIQSNSNTVPTKQSLTTHIATNGIEDLKTPKSTKRRGRKRKNKKNRRHNKRSTGKKEKRNCKKDQDGKKKCRKRKSKKERNKKPSKMLSLHEW